MRRIVPGLFSEPQKVSTGQAVSFNRLRLWIDENFTRKDRKGVKNLFSSEYFELVLDDGEQEVKNRAIGVSECQLYVSNSCSQFAAHYIY